MRRQLIFFIIISASFGCKKFVSVNPPITEVTGSDIYSNNTSASAAMTGIYDNMIASTGLSSGPNSISFLDGLYSDELRNYNSSNKLFSQFYSNSLNSSNSDPGWWDEIYREIYATNSVIEGLTASKGVTPSMKAQLDGEARFMRAFLFFYAVNIYGDVPLPLTTNYLVNNVIQRSPKAIVYQQIVKDLKDAQTELTNDFLDPYGNVTNERVRPNLGAAMSLLARVYLYTGKWDSAETQSTAVINNTALYSLDSNLNNVFLANSTEAIWQFEAIWPGTDTWDAQYLVLHSIPGSGSNSVALDSFLVNAFEVGDLRRTNWVGTYTSDSIEFYDFPYKYKLWKQDPNPPTEYTMVLRLAEQYLIRAEARAQQNEIQGAQNDLNTIRTRAGLPNTTANDQTSLLSAILHERQVELFTEWGHRWFDLIRTGNVNSVMGSPGNVCQIKGGNWNIDWALLPIPYTELLANSSLTQNAGY